MRDCDRQNFCNQVKAGKQLNLAEFIAHGLRCLCEHPMRSNHARVAGNEGRSAEWFVVVQEQRIRLPKRKTGGDVLEFEKPQAAEVSRNRAFCCGWGRYPAGYLVSDGRLYHGKRKSSINEERKIDGA